MEPLRNENEENSSRVEGLRGRVCVWSGRGKCRRKIMLRYAKGRLIFELFQILVSVLIFGRQGRSFWQGAEQGEGGILG